MADCFFTMYIHTVRACMLYVRYYSYLQDIRYDNIVWYISKRYHTYNILEERIRTPLPAPRSHHHHFCVLCRLVLDKVTMPKGLSLIAGYQGYLLSILYGMYRIHTYPISGCVAA